MADLTELDQLPELLKKISREEWHKLFDLLEEIDRTESFGELKGGNKLEDGTIEFPYYSWASVVDKFFHTVYDLGIVVQFDWPDWNEGMEILNNTEYKYDNLDTITLCKLITMILRKDRFCDGILVCHFENGVIAKIIKALEKSVVREGFAV